MVNTLNPPLCFSNLVEGDYIHPSLLSLLSIKGIDTLFTRVRERNLEINYRYGYKIIGKTSQLVTILVFSRITLADAPYFDIIEIVRVTPSHLPRWVTCYKNKDFTNCLQYIDSVKVFNYQSKKFTLLSKGGEIIYVKSCINRDADDTDNQEKHD